MVSSAEEWPWSSYRAMAGLETSEPFVHTDWILGLFSGIKSQARSSYISFVHDGVGKDSPLKAAKGGLFVGNETFVGKFRELLGASAAGEESVRREKYAARPPLKEIFNSLNSLDRDAGIHDAVIKWGYTLKEVGDYVGLHYSRVSRVAKNKAKNKT